MGRLWKDGRIQIGTGRLQAKSQQKEQHVKIREETVNAHQAEVLKSKHGMGSECWCE